MRPSAFWNQLLPPWTWNEYFVPPAAPFFVMMLMTPRAASVPYSVAAAGPLSTSMFSISLGSKSLRREMTPELNACTAMPLPVALFTRTPSTYTSGWLESENVPDAADADVRASADLPVPGSDDDARRAAVEQRLDRGHRRLRGDVSDVDGGDRRAEGAQLLAARRAGDDDLIQLDRALRTTRSARCWCRR